MFSARVDEAAARVSQAIREAGREPGGRGVTRVLRKIENSQSLNTTDCAVVLGARNGRFRKTILEHAARVTRENFGGGIGLLAPLYFDSRCENRCSYCGMAANARSAYRSRLDYDSFLQELEILKRMRFNTIIAVGGRVDYDLELLRKMMQSLKDAVDGPVFCLDSLDQSEYAVFVDPAYTMFHWQETYNRTYYAAYHPADTKKGDYDYRLDAVERALAAGLKKFGIGALFGLYHFVEDALMTVGHGRYLEATYQLPPTVVSINRLKKAPGAQLQQTGFEISDDDLLAVAAMYRLAFPRAEIIATSRECPEYIGRLLACAATFTNYGASNKPGGYQDVIRKRETSGQFEFHSSGLRAIEEVAETAGLAIDFRRSI